MSHFSPAPAIAGPTVHRHPSARMRLIAAGAALCFAIPGAAFVIDALSGDGPAPVQIAKKGSFDITE